MQLALNLFNSVSQSVSRFVVVGAVRPFREKSCTETKNHFAAHICFALN